MVLWCDSDWNDLPSFANDRSEARILGVIFVSSCCCIRLISATGSICFSSRCLSSWRIWLKYLLLLNSLRFSFSSCVRIFKAFQSLPRLAVTSFRLSVSAVTFYCVRKYVPLSRLAIRKSDDISFCFCSSSFSVVIASRNFPYISLICTARFEENFMSNIFYSARSFISYVKKVSSSIS